MKKEKNNRENILIPMPIEDIMGDRFGRYSKYIIQDRALPDARDGLKPVQRRILYAMHNDGNTADKQYRKSAKTVGLVIGNYHPHGDSSVYEAMVRLSQNWKVRTPLIDMHGNNGSIDDDPAAAMRYTEARLSKISSTMMADIDKNTVEFIPNFDDTDQEPTVLPAMFPTLLVNGATGIAAGYATNIPPCNLTEVIQATIFRIMHEHSNLDSLMEILPGPDFPTGGIVQGKDGIKEAFQTGKGRVAIRAKVEIVENKTIDQLVITEIPYEVIKANLVRKMDDIRLSKEVDGILDIRDESDRNGLKIVVDIKKDLDSKLILNYFYKNTDLQVYYNYNMVAIVNKTPKQMGLLDLLDAFIDHRKEVVINRSKYELEKMEKRCHVLEGLMKAVSVMDEIIKIIRQSKDKKDSKDQLCNHFNFSDEQAEAIVTLRLYRLSSTDIVALREEFALLVNKIEEYKTILEDVNVLKLTIINELKQIVKDYPMPRKTIIEEKVEDIVIDKTSMIANERVMITVSKDGYTKRVSLRSFAATEGLTGLKESDELIGSMEVDTLDTLILFTSFGNYIYLPVYEIEEAKWRDVGLHVSSRVKIDPDDKIVNAIVIKNFDSYAWIVTISDNGMIKKTPIKQWDVQRNNKTFPAMKMKKGDVLVKAFLCYAHQEILVISKNGFITRYNSDLIPSTNTKSRGVKAMNFSKGDLISSSCVLPDENYNLFVLTNRGLMKRVRYHDIEKTSRVVKGEMICKKLKTNPYEIIDIKAVGAYDEIKFQDPNEIIIQAKDVPLMQKDATFSSVVDLSNAYIYEKQIEECLIVDVPNDENLMEDKTSETAKKSFENFELLDLFDE
ncbi:MAG: DNA topoisomerase IV subunit A [Anaerorhabdus sp.]